MRFVITGAGGLLGGETVRLLSVDADNEVIALSSQPAAVLRTKWALQDATVRVRVESPESFFDRPTQWGRVDAVINSAWPLNLGGAELARGLQFHVSLFRAVQQAGASTLVNVSSQSVYDATRDGPADERAPLDLDTPYAAGKYACELMAEQLCPDVRIIQARLSSLIAPGFERRLVNKMTLRALREGAITLVSPGQVFDFMDARDAARALTMLASHPPEESVAIVNVGANAPMTLQAIANTVKTMVADANGRPPEIDYADETPRVFSSWLDAEYLRRAWKFKPDFGVRDTIASVIDSVRSRL